MRIKLTFARLKKDRRWTGLNVGVANGVLTAIASQCQKEERPKLVSTITLETEVRTVK